MNLFTKPKCFIHEFNWMSSQIHWLKTECKNCMDYFYHATFPPVLIHFLYMAVHFLFNFDRSRCPTDNSYHFCYIWKPSNSKRNKSGTKPRFSFELRREFRTCLLSGRSRSRNTVTVQHWEIQWESVWLCRSINNIAVRSSGKHLNSAHNSLF